MHPSIGGDKKMDEHIITKSVWLTAAECPTQAWKIMRQASPGPTEAELFRMEQGQEIGALARELYPDGILVKSSPDRSAADETLRLLDQPTTSTLFEATFTQGAYVAKADIIQHEEDGWHFIEAKSSFADTKKLDAIINDLAYTVMVGRAAGLTVSRASLLLLSRAYKYDDPVQSLFEIVDQTDSVNEWLIGQPKTLDVIETELLSANQPEPRLVATCRDCQFFHKDCLGADLKNTIFELPRLHSTKLKQLSDMSIIALSDLPSDFKLTEIQDRARESALTGDMHVSDSLHATLATVEWPAHYLDFETVMTVLPLYEDHGCHEQVLTQFSIHHCDRPGNVTKHDGYLANPIKECQRDIAEHLIESLGNHGSILVYSSFEKTRVNDLCHRFPDLREKLENIINRFVDLLAIISKHVYHPNFRGSFSIKNVLPALVPDLSYDDLGVRDGDTAIARFAKLARNKCTQEESVQIRQELLKYCERDTIAMVRLHEQLSQY